MARKNNKQQIINYENTIQKSNEFSMAKLNYGLTLNQMQLLAFSIYSTQKNGRTEFKKVEFEKKFNLGEYRREEALQDSKKLFDLAFSLDDLETGNFDFLHVFQRISYKNGLFSFKWSEDVIPHILELKDKYTTTDLTIQSKFKSSFSWILYDYLKGLYGYWHIPISKDALMRLFCVDKVKSYLKNTSLFKQKVLDVAIEEINQYTELEVWYKEIKEGRSIVEFDLYWTTGEKVESATKKQIQELKTILDLVFEDSFRYIDLNNKENRKRAFSIIRELESYKEFTEEPICITKKKAEILILNANAYLRELESYLEQERKEKKGTVPFYNWLEE